MKTRAAILTGFTAALILAGPAHATRISVNLRIEGATRTLFEGPMLVEGHDVQAASDTKQRHCDATNNGAHTVPGATPTAVASDAMEIVGEQFDGQWYPGYDDYFITRFGPDQQDPVNNEYWGLLVNDTFIPEGGCQFALAATDRVLWVYNGFQERPFLTLSLSGEAAGAAIPTATVALGQPLTVQVEQYRSTEGSHHDLGPVTSAAVAPVATAANGFQDVEESSPASVTTGSSGTATIVYSTPGWHRLKATLPGAIRSNRLDVCVPAKDADSCGPLPADDQARSTEPSLPKREGVTPEEEHPDGPKPGSSTALGSATEHPGSAQLLGAEPLARSKARLLRVDGLTLEPFDDRAPRIQYEGQWRRANVASAWMGTISAGRARGSLSLRLAAGRAVFVIRGARKGASVELIAAGRRQRIRVKAQSSAGARALITADRARPGPVRLRILRGTVGIDAVALTH